MQKMSNCTDVVSIPRHSPDSLIEVSLETYRADSTQADHPERLDTNRSSDSCTTYTGKVFQ